MTTVAFVTFCHPPRYVEKLHRPGVLRAMVGSHRHPFDDVLVVHQRCRAADYPAFGLPCRTADLPEREFDDLLWRFGVEPSQPDAERISHGPGAAHYWKHHLVNHLKGLEETDSDYVVFADCDTWIKESDPARSWVEEAVQVLERYPTVLIVGPGDGGTMAEATVPEARLTRNVSQQLFCCRGEQFRNEVNFDAPWDGRMDAPGGPMQEYYVMLEGRLWRYMEAMGYWRAVLPDRWRYWHDSYWGDN